MSRIGVGGGTPYEVLIGRNAVGELPGFLGDGVRQVAVVTAPPVRAYADQVAELLTGAGMRAHLLDVPDAEAAKDVSVAARCWERLGALAFTRSDAVVGVGGGAVTDLAGFVAATWLRGVRVAHVPTSLLGMVDAAVGGKTGINSPAGKNLVGAFHPPVGVVCDLDALATLPVEEYVAGLAEVVKVGFIADPTILDLLESDPGTARRHDGPYTQELVERSVRVKADVVSDDLRERGGREVLNYGHTLAHAIERVESYRWRHGHAVAVGLAYVAELARLAGRLDDATCDRHRTLLTALGLPTTYRADSWPELLAAMRVDKKARGAMLRFVVLDGLASPGVLSDPAPELLEQAYAATRERAKAEPGGAPGPARTRAR